jgi:linoleoyl-CoA desaturase
MITGKQKENAYHTNFFIMSNATISNKVTFNNKNSVFYNTLKQSVDAYFAEKNIKKTGNWKLYLKSGILIPMAVAIYLTLILVQPGALVSLLLVGLLGSVMASIGFNVMHDACHGSFSSRKWVNELFGLSLNALGGNAFIWKMKHNIIHHTYTNVDGIDDDIAKLPVIRQCETQKWYPAHRFQHLYLPLVYCITSFVWIMVMDYGKYFTKRIQATPMKKMDRKEHIIFWASKLLYITFYIAIPIMVLGFKPWIIGFLTMHAVLGLILALVFQLAHVVEHTEFEAAGIEPKMIDSEWAIHQVKTTANFAPKNKFISWYVGGLNFQIEHHLFPRVSHVHYPALSKIVKETCQKFDIYYNEFPTMSKAVVSHFKMMKQFGEKPLTEMAAA